MCVKHPNGNSPFKVVIKFYRFRVFPSIQKLLKMAVASDSFRLLAGELIKNTERLRDMLAVVGLIVVGKVAVDTSVAFLSAVRIFLLSKLRSLSNFKERYGPWAIVTGATDGIGKEYARELARLGVNIILMSRSIDKLTKVAQEIGNSTFFMLFTNNFIFITWIYRG